MGKRGPQPAPTALKIVRGDRPSRIAKNEPTPPAVEVKMPPALDKRAQQVWKQLAPSLKRQGLLSAWDVDNFASYCRAVSMQEAAAADVAKHGLIIDGARGRVRNPAVVVLRDAAATMLRLAPHFGLTPSTRGDIDLPGAAFGGDEDGQDDILTG